MSYDLKVWSIRPASNENLPASAGWQEGVHCWLFNQGQGMLEVYRSDKVLLEDIPKDISCTLPGIAFCTILTASGKLVKSLLTHQKKIGRELAIACHGVLFDPQDGALLTPTGVRRFIPTPRASTFSITKMSWWTLDNEAFNLDGIKSVVDSLRRLLPESMPRRYGLWEPPQQVYEATEHQQFLEYLQHHIHETIVWYPSRPVLDVSLQSPNPPGLASRGFRTHRVSIDIETSALDQPGWQEHLRRTWHELSNLLRPFYGDVRTLSGYKKMGGGLGIGRGTEMHPVNGWWWRGVPETPASAVVLGPTYQRLWPEFMSGARLESGLAFLDGADWKHPLMYSVPAGLAQGEEAPALSFIHPERYASNRGEYAEVWPFEGPFSTT